MGNSVASVLMVTGQHANVCQELTDFLNDCGCELVIVNDWGASIQQAQDRTFQVIILDTRVRGMDIKKAIHIFKNFDPKVKIIVKTDSSSKNLESQIRQEKIYYYHIESFDADDLKLAVKSAIEG